MFIAVKRVEKILKSSLDSDAFTIGIKDGEAAGQEIPHLHINVIPRFLGEGGGPIYAVIENPSGKIPQYSRENEEKLLRPDKNKKMVS